MKSSAMVAVPMRHDRRLIHRAAFATSLLVVVRLAGCTPDFPLGDAARDESAAKPCGELTYENFGAQFFATYCLHCHNSSFEDDLQRSDAPLGIDFNTLSGVRGFQRRIRLRAGELGDMPPRLLTWVAQPTEEERAALIRWLDCGAPTATDGAPP